MPPRILATGIDTLEVGFYADLSESVFARLDEAWEKKAPKEEVGVEIGGVPHQLHRMAGIQGWRWGLVCPFWAVKLAERRGSDAAPDVGVTYRSAFLWERGPSAAVAASLITLWPDLGREPVRNVVTRADLAMDWCDWSPIPSDWLNFVRRVRHFVSHWEPLLTAQEEACLAVADAIHATMPRWQEPGYPELVSLVAWNALTTWARSEVEECGASFDLERTADSYADGRVFTGFSWGRGALGGRLYRKDVEIRKSSGKTWFYPVWAASAPLHQRSGFERELRGTHEHPRPIWRLEFQCRRAVLREFHVEDLDDLWRYAGGLWKHLTTKWLSLRTPMLTRTGTEMQRNRWPVDPAWASLASHRFTLGQHPVVRERIRELDLRATRDRAVVAMMKDVALNPRSGLLEKVGVRAALRWFETECRAYFDEKETSWAEGVEDARDKAGEPVSAEAVEKGIRRRPS